MIDKLSIYDIECLPDIFTFRAVMLNDLDSSYRFEISDRVNEIEKLQRFYKYLIRNGIEQVGYNNLMYDYPVIHEVLHTDPVLLTPKYIRAISDRVINDHSMGGFGPVIWGKRQLVPQWDVYLIHHFNNKNRRTSLKAIEFWQRSNNIKELEGGFNDPVGEAKFEDVHGYNLWDVLETAKFTVYSLPMFELRQDLMKESKRDLRWCNNGKIGEGIFIDLLGYDNCFTKVNGKRTPRGTPRESVTVSDILSDKIQLSLEPFVAIEQFFKQQVIKGTNGAFADLEYPDYLEPHMAKVMTDTAKKKRLAMQMYVGSGGDMLAHYPKGTLAFVKRFAVDGDTSETEGKIEKLNVLHDGLQYDFGTGGLHASRHKAKFFEDDEYTIKDWDFTAYYPSLGRVLGICPEQFDPELWASVQQEIWDRRQSFKKKTAGYIAYKEAGNIPYGKSGFDKSCFYDPKYMVSICVNGQLLLLSLVEEVVKKTGAQIIQVNTDGLTFKVKREYNEVLSDIMSDFEARTDLAIEEAVYKSMHIRDVNNYIAVTIDDEAKLKGTYEVDKLPHKDTSMTVVSKAVLANILDDVEIEDFIYAHDDVYDFFKRVKLTGKSYVEYNGQRRHEKVLRYYASTTDNEMIKYTKSTTGSVEATTGTTLMQEVVSTDMPKDIDYGYYVREAYKIIGFEE